MATRTSPPSAALVIIGDEILSAKTEEENARYLSRELRELGVPLARILVVPDDVEAIAWAIREARAVARYVFTSGGIGPTHDDVTVEGIAAAFGRRVVRHPRLEAMIRGYLAGKPEAEIESALKMAELPEGAELVEKTGLTFPLACVENVFIFPGIPKILRRKWTAVREMFRQAPYHLVQVYLTPDEHVVASPLYELKARFPDLMLGSYPDIENAEYRVKVTLESKDTEYLRSAVAHLLSLIDPALVVRVEPPPVTP